MKQKAIREEDWEGSKLVDEMTEKDLQEESEEWIKGYYDKHGSS